MDTLKAIKTRRSVRAWEDVIGVYLGKEYRQLTIPSNLTFSSLADEILPAFDIDDWEHLYDQIKLGLVI